MERAKVSATTSTGRTSPVAPAPSTSRGSSVRQSFCRRAAAWPATATSSLMELVAPPQICAPPTGTSAATATMWPKARPPAIAKAAYRQVNHASSWLPPARRPWACARPIRRQPTTCTAAEGWGSPSRKPAHHFPVAWVLPTASPRTGSGTAVTRATACKKRRSSRNRVQLWAACCVAGTDDEKLRLPRRYRDLDARCGVHRRRIRSWPRVRRGNGRGQRHRGLSRGDHEPGELAGGSELHVVCQALRTGQHRH